MKIVEPDRKQNHWISSASALDWEMEKEADTMSSA
jgi:hypothetical protein